MSTSEGQLRLSGFERKLERRDSESVGQWMRKTTEKIYKCSEGGHVEGGEAEEDARDRMRQRQMNWLWQPLKAAIERQRREQRWNMRYMTGNNQKQ